MVEYSRGGVLPLSRSRRRGVVSTLISVFATVAAIVSPIFVLLGWFAFGLLHWLLLLVLACRILCESFFVLALGILHCFQMLC